MNAKTVAGWAGAAVAVGGAVVMYLGPVTTGIQDAIAQEAAEAVEEAFEEKVAPLATQFRRQIELDRREDDRAELAICMAERIEITEGDRRKRRCDAESDYRWAYWGWIDCTDLNGKDAPTCTKPDELHRMESQRR